MDRKGDCSQTSAMWYAEREVLWIVNALVSKRLVMLCVLAKERVTQQIYSKQTVNCYAKKVVNHVDTKIAIASAKQKQLKAPFDAIVAKEGTT